MIFHGIFKKYFKIFKNSRTLHEEELQNDALVSHVKRQVAIELADNLQQYVHIERGPYGATININIHVIDENDIGNLYADLRRLK